MLRLFKSVRILTLVLISLHMSACGYLDRWGIHKQGSRGYKNYGEEDGYAARRVKFNLSVDRYASCAELQGDIRAQLVEAQAAVQRARKTVEAREKVSAPTPGASAVKGDAANSAQSDAGTLTNTQVAGVDEGDSIKIGNDHIFVLRTNKILVIDRASFRELGGLEVPKIADNQGDQSVVSNIGYYSPVKTELYTSAGRLVVISSFYKQTLVQIYEASKDQLPKLLDQQKFEGSLYGSRLIANQLVFTLNSNLNLIDANKNQSASIYTQLYAEGSIADAPVVIQDDSVSGLPCAAIAKPLANDLDLRLTKIFSINIQDSSAPIQALGILGAGDQIYMTKTDLYLTKYGMGGYYPMVISDWQTWQTNNDISAINKVSFDEASGTVSLVARGEVRGRAKDQFAFQAYEAADAIAVATTFYDVGEMRSETNNRLTVLKQDGQSLKEAALVTDLGRTEDIRSVRFVNDMAYIVTFKKTDPLYAIDMSEPLAPVLMGELKIPGFSTYMHPIDDKRLIGVGFDADDQGSFAWFQGIQVSLFDVSDPKNLRRADNKIHGDRGSSSEVTSDHHAFYFNKDLSLVGVPIIELTGKDKPGGSSYGDELKFSGAIFYKIVELSLQEVGRISHQEMIPESCKKQMNHGQWWSSNSRSQDVRRIFSVDDALITISPFGIKKFTWENLQQPVAQTKFSNDARVCESRY